MANKGNYYIGIRLLLLKQFLEYHAGPNRYVTRKQIEKFLKEKGFPVEKKTIYADLAVLGRVFDMQIDYDEHKKGYYLLNPSFNPYELRLLMDCVQTSTLITDDEVKSLTTKIKRMAYEDDRNSLDRTVTVNSRINRAEDSILRKVDIIHQALQHKRKISFRYFKYVAERGQHREYYATSELDDRFIINPKRLVWDDGSYFLEFHRTDNDDFTPFFCPVSFEVERMSDIQILSEIRDAIEMPHIKPNLIPPEVMDMMFGKEHIVTIRFRNNFVQEVLDFFGNDTITIPLDDNHFTITLRDRCGPELYMKILTFGCYAKILSPQSAVDGMNSYIRDMTQLYSSDAEPYYVLSQKELDDIYIDDNKYPPVDLADLDIDEEDI